MLPIIKIVWDKLPDVLTSKDIAEAGEMSERSARKLIKDLGGMKIAGKLMIAKSKLKKFFED